MSFPEGQPEPSERTPVDDSGDAVDPAPKDGPFSTLLDPIRRHFDTWAGRYVEMRVEARTGRRE
ncbi:hypothetical protein [Haloarchaeobius litoreus]|uniref:Uncharacterized protein n=1 Tax=Haloarchaeobius litoreus TaxID=755306 RepID=A0ABD6DMV1_9EURY|nr:hypothetical protein [Haloarchaeobius litoreus]